jgi:hypothetical protein
MRRNRQGLLWLGVSILGVLAFSPPLAGQVSGDYKVAGPVTTDWSQQHLIFSKPATAEQARRVEQDPRYWQQLRRQSPARLPELVETPGALASQLQPGSNTSPASKVPKLNRDWSQDLGTGATVGATNYPAKYSLTTTTASCASAAQPDFAVYATGLAGSASQASIVAYDNLYSGCSGVALATAANFAILASSTATNAGDSVITGGNIGISPGTSLTGFPPGVLTPPAVEQLGNPVAAQAQADATTAFNYYQGLTGGTIIAPVMDGLTFGPGLYTAGSTLALSAGATVTLNGTGTYIFQIGSTLNIAGTVLLSGGATAGNVIWLVGSSATLEGTAVAAGSIVAYASITLDGGASVAGRVIALNGAVTMIDNAITTVDTVPSVYWAYNTNAGTVTTSPLFSLDGTQVAFVQTNGAGDGHFVLLRWAASDTDTIANPTTLTRLPTSEYPGCTSPCMTTIRLTAKSGAPTADTNSSIFYDYSNDIAYVGDDSGWLHKFTPVFNGIPTEVRSGGWPVEVNPGAATALTSPVYDKTSGAVFVADNAGFLYQVGPGTPSVTTSGQLDFSSAADGGPGLIEGPVVDATSERVYVFATSDGSGGCPGGTDCTAVYQLAVDFPDGDPGSETVVGSSSLEPTQPSPLYIGGFDSAYENSLNATGNLYVCGNTGGPPVLYQIPILAGALGTINVGPVLSTDTTPCSPVTDVPNPNAAGGPTEWIFASVQNGGSTSACASGGCIFNFKDTPWTASTAYTVGQEVLDTHFQIQVVTKAGTSSASAPDWSTKVGKTTDDGTVHWLDQGVPSAFTPASWAGSQPYAKGNQILVNGNIQLVTTAGTSGTGIPTFNATAGGTTHDGTGMLVWTNAGAIATAAMPEAGGTSGIIFDNTVGSGILAGASQIYFSTLGNGTCGGGCAVQASQPALQ